MVNVLTRKSGIYFFLLVFTSILIFLTDSNISVCAQETRQFTACNYEVFTWEEPYCYEDPEDGACFFDEGTPDGGGVFVYDVGNCTDADNTITCDFEGLIGSSEFCRGEHGWGDFEYTVSQCDQARRTNSMYGPGDDDHLMTPIAICRVGAATYCCNLEQLVINNAEEIRNGVTLRDRWMSRVGVELTWETAEDEDGGEDEDDPIGGTFGCISRTDLIFERTRNLTEALNRYNATWTYSETLDSFGCSGIPYGGYTCEQGIRYVGCLYENSGFNRQTCCPFIDRYPFPPNDSASFHERTCDPCFIHLEEDDGEYIETVEYEDCRTELTDSEALDEEEACYACLLNNGEETGAIWTGLGCLDTSPVGLITRLFQIGLGILGGLGILRVIQISLVYIRGDEEEIAETRDMMKSLLIGTMLMIVGITFLQFVGVNVLGLPAGFLGG